MRCAPSHPLAAAAELRARLTVANAPPDDLVRSLIDATDMTLDEARTFVAYFEMK